MPDAASQSLRHGMFTTIQNITLETLVCLRFPTKTWVLNFNNQQLQSKNIKAAKSAAQQLVYVCVGQCVSGCMGLRAKLQQSERGHLRDARDSPGGSWRIHIWHSSSWRGIYCRCSWRLEPEPPAHGPPDTALCEDTHTQTVSDLIGMIFESSFGVEWQCSWFLFQKQNSFNI